METPVHFSRRSILGSAAAAAGLSFLCRPVALRAAPVKTGRGMSPAELKPLVRGPINAIPTPFTADDKVDFDGVRKMVRMGLDQGITAFELTAGDSQYHALSYDEAKELTRVLVEAVGDKGIAIGATNTWWTSRAIDYVEFAEKVGAHGVQVLKPQGDDNGILEHYKQIAASTKLGIVLHGVFGLPVLEKLVGIDSIVAMKEDSTEKYMFDILRKFGRRLAIFGGGQKWRFLVGQPYGLTGYLSMYSTFAPQIATRFWKAVESGDMAAAREVMLRYDQPMFDFMLEGSVPFHAWWRATLEYFGIAKRYLRKPETSCSDQDMTKLKAFWEGLGLRPTV